MTARLAVDVGGTFTDLMYCDDDTGAVVVAKGASTPDAPNRGVVDLVRASLSPEQVAGIGHFLHGSTVGLNALIERKGAAVGLLTTTGFRDALEIRRGDRGTSPYDILWRSPEPLVPRHLRLAATERIAADGGVLTPLQVDGVRAAAAEFKAQGVNSVAIVFLNAYANPEHELAAADALQSVGFTGAISLSHLVSGEIGFYERTSTTVIDAYVRPMMSKYLRDLEAELVSAGLSADCLITRSGGGALPFAEAEQRPFESVISGPVAGAVGAAKLCAVRGVKQAITADVGGTSFDTCLIVDGQPQTKYQGEVIGMPVQSPWVDVRSVGAGGGSLAAIEGGGILRVGPDSAGAMPGPACYGRGGTQPTITDAAAVLGMLGAGDLAGGLSLDMAAAQAAVGGLGDVIGIDADAAAAGTVRIANAAMAAAVRTITVEQGIDPRDCTLLAFGGAGPLFGALLADELGIEEVLIPVHAGNFSAVGLLGQDIVRSAARTMFGPFDEHTLDRAEQLALELFDSLPTGEKRELAFDMRYAGQLHTLTIGVPAEAGSGAAGIKTISTLFTSEYKQTFGYTMSGPLEIVAVRATTRVPLVELPVRPNASTDSSHAETEAYSFRSGTRINFQVVERAALRIEAPIPGPLIITEPTATTYVDTGFNVETQLDGTLLIRNLEVTR